MDSLFNLVTGLALGGLGGGVLALIAVFWLRRKFNAPNGKSWGRTDRIITHSVAERVRSVGKLVGLEVAAKEIVTTTSGWGFLPPLLLSQARLAMIFQFEKRYEVDLAALSERDVTRLGEASYRLTLPPIRPALRLVDVTPYDIQAAKVLGLLDIAPMSATRQKEMMDRAQAEAAAMLDRHDDRYRAEARASVERHLRTLLGLLDLDVEIVWQAAPAGHGSADEPEGQARASEPSIGRSINAPAVARSLLPLARVNCSAASP